MGGARALERPGCRSARTGEARPLRLRVLGSRGAPILSCPLPAERRAPGAGARGLARLSRGVCIPRWAGACPAMGGLRPLSRRASSQCPRNPPFSARTQGSLGGRGRCGGPTAFILRAWGWVFLGSAVGWCSVEGEGWGSRIGAEEAAESSCPCYFGGSACSCHFRSHSCTENTVADTQQDDLLAVIHGEASQAGCCCCCFYTLVINLTCRVEDTTVRTTN